MTFQRYFILPVTAVLISACTPSSSPPTSFISRLWTCPAPSLVSINIIDRNGFTETISNPDRLSKYENINFLDPQPYEKVLRVYSKDPLGNIAAFITSYHPNGLLKQYLEVMNGRAFGTYKEWFSNGTLKIEARVIGGVADLTDGTERSWLFDGECKAWNEKQELEATILYTKGELDGTSLYYHSNGNIWKSVPFQQNKIEGMYEIFLENGQLLQRVEYRGGLRHGKALRYWDQNRISSEELYDQGLLSKGDYYSRSGEVVCRIENGEGYKALFTRDEIAELHEYHGGIQEGEVKVFNKAQKLVALYHVKDNLKHGEEIGYYDIVRLNQAPVQKLSVNWYNGKLQGIAKTWYENGFLESQKEMSDNKKNGHSTAFYKDGSLMMIEEYDHDKLVKGEYFEKGERSPVSEVSNGKGVATLYDAEGTFLRKVNYNNGKPDLDSK